jgi:hypothetical protein
VAEDWSAEEVAATVADYFAMLGHELRGEPYNKREHNRRLQGMLRGRSAGAIEFKHANISAILIQLGFPYIDGYKPRANYQELLRDEVVVHLDRDAAVIQAAADIVAAPAATPAALITPSDVFVPPPVRDIPGAYERRPTAAVPLRQINYLEREARNASLGAAGELFVLDVEHQRLWEAGRRQLAERIEHVSRQRGDGLGYDVLSFEENGRERLIEVKTTTFGSMTPFFASAREVAVSETQAEAYHLYRVYKFRESPRIFSLQGSLRQSCVLDPVQFRASLP